MLKTIFVRRPAIWVCRTPYFLRTMDLNELASSQDPLLDGFVMNNVLYSIKDMLGVLRAIRGRLKKGAMESF